METMFNSIILPLLGHFLIEPTLYACIIYYPLMCIFAILDVLLPYVISLALIVLSVGILLSSRYFMQMRYRSLAVLCITVIVGGGLLWASIEMNESRNSKTMFADPVENGNIDADMFEKQKSKPAEVDDMFKNID